MMRPRHSVWWARLRAATWTLGLALAFGCGTQASGPSVDATVDGVVDAMETSHDGTTDVFGDTTVDTALDAATIDSPGDLAVDAPEASEGGDTGCTVCGGECVDVMTNRLHCGACDKPCFASSYVCVAGKCVCPTGMIDCAGLACVKCPSGSVCVAGSCTCPSPRVICGTDSCADLTTDALNCGACGTICASGSKCVASKCTP